MLIFRLIHNTRRRILHVLNRSSKSSSTVDILAIDFNSFRRRFEYQFTADMNWKNIDIDIDHVKPNSLFDVSEDKEVRGAFNWLNRQPLLNEVHSRKGNKFDFLVHRLQFIKACQFLK